MNQETASRDVTFCLSMGDKLVVKKVNIRYKRSDGSSIKMPDSADDKDAVIVHWDSGTGGYNWYQLEDVPRLTTLGEFISKTSLSEETFINFKDLTETVDTIMRVKWGTVNVGDDEYRLLQYIDYESHILTVTHTIIHLLPQILEYRDPLTDEVIHVEEFDPIEIEEDIELDDEITISPKDFLLLKPEEFDKRRLDTLPSFKAEAAQTETIATPLSKPPSISLKKDIEKMRSALRKHKIQHLYHITHENNLDGILTHGLLSHNSAHDFGIVKKDISMRDVNERRNRIEPVLNKNLHDYTPLYFNPRNPMMYVRRLTESNLIVVQISSDVLLRDNVLFSDGNAASTQTIFYSSEEDLGKLNFSIIQGGGWNGIPDGKRIICAEVLVDARVDIQYFESVIVRTMEQKSRLSGLVEKVPHLRTQFNPAMFFG
ncbi:MAG: DUF4433 domain-containing protein [Candidatus Marinimicrobia bacterium]|nr:DUF4433 domain-containing protein [Candidatus Neomarinimicrobiota bacterium]